MLKKAYIEITNRCNLRCSFCPGTKRAPRTMTPAEFDFVLERLTGQVEYVYLHVMGEPLGHPQLAELLALAAARERKVCITTNGTLLARQTETLLAAPTLHKVSVSLHSFEGNDGAQERERQYLEEVWSFAALIPQPQRDDDALRGGSFRLRDNLYLERAKKFDWPDLSAQERGTQFCYGLRDQLGVLADGTAVPCCLDYEGDIALGNLFTQPLAEILQSERACALREGFSRRCPSEELCRRCGFAARF